MKIYPSNLNHIRYTKPTNEEIQQKYNFPCSITVFNQALSTAEVFYYDGEGNEFPQGRFNIPSDYLFKKALLKTDTAPTIKGLYPLLETGIYTNLGRINATTGNLNFASFDGTTWSLIAVAMPTGISLNEVNASLAGKGLLQESFVTTEQIKPTPFSKYTSGATLDYKTHNAWYVGKSTKKVNEVYVPITSVYNGATPLTDSVYVRIALNGTFIYSTEITIAQMTAQGIDTQAGTEAKSMYKLTVPEFTINNTDIIYVGMMTKGATDKLGFVATSAGLSNEWVNGYNSRGSTDINALSTAPAPSGSGFAYNIYFKYKETVYVGNIPTVSQSKGSSTTSVMSQNAVSAELAKNESAIELKSDRHFDITSTFNNKANINNTYPFWMQTNNAAPFKYVQFNMKAKSKMVLKSMDFAGAYITTDLTLGTGNVSLRIYKGVTFNGYISVFTNAVLLRKVSIPIADFYANSTKATTSAELKAKLLAGELGYTTFNFNPLDVEKDDVLYFYFGADDDSYYQNSPNTAAPTMRISLVESTDAAMLGTQFSHPYPSTFYFTSQALLSNTSSIPAIVINSMKEKSTWNKGVIDINSRNIYTYVGAFNTVLDALFTAKPTARVLIIGHHTVSGRTTTNQSAEFFKPQNEIQQRIADYWGVLFLPLWQKLGWKNNGAGALNTYKTWVPDEIHPYSNPTKVSTAIGQMSVADVIIKDFVKETLKPIFGENWAGKKVATYGTSIPYGGKYTILAVQELGGTAQNYCSSGSYIRRGKTDNVPVSNSFTDGADTTYRNYVKDMLNLIGTSNEPDLFVFDFSVNDYNLDQSDFDVTY